MLVTVLIKALKTSSLYCDASPNRIKVLNSRPSLEICNYVTASVCSELPYVGELRQQIKHGVCVNSWAFSSNVFCFAALWVYCV